MPAVSHRGLTKHCPEKKGRKISCEHKSLHLPRHVSAGRSQEKWTPTCNSDKIWGLIQFVFSLLTCDYRLSVSPPSPAKHNPIPEPKSQHPTM